jgi:Zn finger protein HypA/HybF involved in hydrogenase expression
MSNLSGNDKSKANNEPQQLQQELDVVEQRWQTFLNKLEEKYDELIAAIEIEGVKAFEEDTDLHKRAYQRFKSGMNGQLDGIRKKANDTCQTQIIDYYYAKNNNPLDDKAKLLYEWYEHCRKIHDQWEARIHTKQDAVWEKIEIADDPELKYNAILQEYESIKNKFKCKQCGSPLTIDKIFFVSAYITCPACGTQNTFVPSAQAKMLEHIARAVAEKRAKPLLEAYQKENSLERELYHQMHELKIKSISDKSKTVQLELAALEDRRQRAIKNAPDLYRKYSRAMFNEWNAIVPDLAEQNEKFYERMLDDFNRMNDNN